MKRPRKKILLINRDFQLRYAFAAAAVGLGTTVMTTLIVLYPLYAFEILRVPRFLPIPILGAMGVAAVANIFLVVFLGIFITHRVAGPMYSLVRCFRRIEVGYWAGKLRIRDGDDLKFVVRNFNSMIDGLIRIGKIDVSDVNGIDALLENGELELARQALRAHRDTLAGRLVERPIEGIVLDEGENI